MNQANTKVLTMNKADHFSIHGIYFLGQLTFVALGRLPEDPTWRLWAAIAAFSWLSAYTGFQVGYLLASVHRAG